MSLISTGPYGVWDNIQVRVTTTTPVTVTGSPTLGVIIGNTEKRASYQSGSGSMTLNFQYTVAAGDGDDPNGISVKANSLSGGTITDTADNTLNPNYPALPDQGAQHRVDTSAPEVSSITFSSTGPYGIGSYIYVTAITSEPVAIGGNQPSLTLVIGSAERQAYLFSNAAMSTSALVFGYRVTAADKDDKDGVSVKGSSLVLNGSVIADNAGNMLNLSHSGISNGGDTQTVGVTVSGISSVAFTSAGPYTLNDTIQVTVSTAEQINVIGTPRIAITVGSDTKYADYVSGSGTAQLLFGSNVASNSRKTALEARYTGTRTGAAKLVFSYTITSDTPIDTDGAQIEARSLWMPSAMSITDATGNAIESTPLGDGSVTVNIRPSSRVSSRPILPAITSKGLIFNEFLNAETDKGDWVELRNISGSEVSLDGWKLNLTLTIEKRLKT